MQSEFSQADKRRPFSVFLVMDARSDREMYSEAFRQQGILVNDYMTAMEFLGDYRESTPGVVIAEARLRGLTGRELQARLDEKKIHLPFVLMISPADSSSAIEGMKQGAIDFVVKPFESKDLIASAARAYAAFYRVDWDFVGEDLDEIERNLSRLTDREREILNLVVDGSSSREIGVNLGISLKTVEAHRARINDKMRADDLPHLIRMMMAIKEAES